MDDLSFPLLSILLYLMTVATDTENEMYVALTEGVFFMQLVVLVQTLQACWDLMMLQPSKL